MNKIVILQKVLTDPMRFLHKELFAYAKSSKTIIFFNFRPEDLHRIRVEHMERQLANLTGLVQKALTQSVPGVPVTVGANLNQNYLGVPGQYRGGMYI